MKTISKNHTSSHSAVTIKDVAKKAKVSVATVSRVINQNYPVSEETKRRVLKAIQELNYSPNPTARSLVLKKTHTIGVVLPDMHGEFFSEIIKEIDKKAREFGYHVLLTSSHSNLQELDEALISLLNGKVDGMIIMNPSLKSIYVETRLLRKTPLVLLNCCGDIQNSDVILIDNYTGAYNLTKHLIKHGHEKIAVITGPVDNFDSIERLKGYKDALKDAGIALSPELEFHGDFTKDSGYEIMKKILVLPSKPTAIFALNDEMAIGAIQYAKKIGLKIPTDIAIVGFDDIPIAEYINPSLTTVRVPIDKVGSLAAEKLFKRIEKGSEIKFSKTILETTLIVRESCGCL
ncbi:LacI family DNA-binding transcriptional regulator [Candidatus Kryptobacter tengchongensis]|uniref:LacI family transcriptional regulator n=1 Tax=Kryptobacter tengchongensis TaxID=1643429 RepID=A0A916PE01_KRYT1|nr:LacI family DNA-binding transcriptional regulator [Candidatus Kryptobacter tengchongensis]CUS99148.1 LacI family transcriptional regulator [Candidatus Kryptobacter tengchongensis]